MNNYQYSVPVIFGTNNPGTAHCVSVMGGTWYVLDGNTNVNFCHHVKMDRGCPVEAIVDADTFTADICIESAGELFEQLEENGYV